MCSCKTPSHKKVQSSEEAIRTFVYTTVGYFELENNLRNAQKDKFYGQHL